MTPELRFGLLVVVIFVESAIGFGFGIAAVLFYVNLLKRLLVYDCGLWFFWLIRRCCCSDRMKTVFGNYNRIFM